MSGDLSAITKIAIDKWEKEAITVGNTGSHKAGFLGMWGSHDMVCHDQGYDLFGCPPIVCLV